MSAKKYMKESGGKIRICLMKQMSVNKSKERERERGKIIVGIV